MEKSFQKLLQGYKEFRARYALGDRSVMQSLAHNGQKPEIMVVACCDSRVDPALILQCDPGDLFVVRNVANIVPSYVTDHTHHGTSAALEFGIRFLGVKHLIILGHSQCGGIQALLKNSVTDNDFIHSWVSLIKLDSMDYKDCDDYAREALQLSYENCFSFPWIKNKVETGQLKIHLWYFDIKEGRIFTYSKDQNKYILL
jgi:carbonic anhydrase